MCPRVCKQMMFGDGDAFETQNVRSAMDLKTVCSQIGLRKQRCSEHSGCQCMVSTRNIPQLKKTKVWVFQGESGLARFDGFVCSFFTSPSTHWNQEQAIEPVFSTLRLGSQWQNRSSKRSCCSLCKRLECHPKVGTAPSYFLYCFTKYGHHNLYSAWGMNSLAGLHGI